MPRDPRKFIVPFLASLALASVSRAGETTLKDVAGHDVRPGVVAAGDRANVLIFALSDCPISNAYAPVVAELYKQFAGQGVRFFVIYCDADLSAAAAAKHQADYGIPCTGVLDPGGVLVKQCHAGVTAEAVVLTADGGKADSVAVYHGAIDDQYAGVGRKRAAVRHAYLADALRDVLAGRTPAVASSKAFGCPLNNE